MKIRLLNDNWHRNFIANVDRLKTRQLADGCGDTNEIDSQTEPNLEEEFQRSDFYQDRDECDLNSFGYTILQDHQVACFDSGGEKLVCFPQVLELIGEKNLLKVKLTIQILGIILTECSPLKLEILHKNHILHPKTTHCGLISQSNAERLCKIFRSSQKKSNDSKNILLKNLFIPLKYRHQIRVVHNCFGQQKGILMPQLCTNYDAQCIECFDCGVWFSPSDFVGHTHNPSGLDSEMSTCHWGFISSNWRLYLHLAEDPSRTAEEERSLNDYLTEIKNHYIQPVYASLTICNDHDQLTPSDSSSFNTSPSMPTPASLSPSEGLNKIDLQNSSSIFQQCIMRICNHHLETSDDRNQLINTLFMLRQEHHQQISTLISERHELIKALNKSPTTNANTIQPAETEENKVFQPCDNSISTLQSIKEKIAILKRSANNKRRQYAGFRSEDQTNGKLRKTDNPRQSDSREAKFPCWASNQSSKEIIDCDSSSVYTQVTEILSSDQQQEMRND